MTMETKTNETPEQQAINDNAFIMFIKKEININQYFDIIERVDKK